MINSKMKILLIATREKGKMDEFFNILKDLKYKLVTLNDINFPKTEPKEKNNLFTENAIIKAKYYGIKSGLPTLADDSGLIVDALPGKLGVRSKRYKKGTHLDRFKQLLKDLKNVEPNKRTARFIAAVAFFDPKTKTLKVAEGICEGSIALAPKGSYGFGYDPVFIVKALGKHFAEITMEEKNRISHRGKALRKIKKYLK